MAKIELYIYNNAQKKMYSPILKDKITWTTEKKGVAGKLTFTVVKDTKIDFSEGDAVTFKYDGKNIFTALSFQNPEIKNIIFLL